MKKQKEPKNLNIRIGTKDQVVWERLKQQTLVQIEQFENSLLVNREILKMAERKIEEEKAKSKQ